MREVDDYFFDETCRILEPLGLADNLDTCDEAQHKLAAILIHYRMRRAQTQDAPNTSERIQCYDALIQHANQLANTLDYIRSRRGNLSRELNLAALLDAAAHESPQRVSDAKNFISTLREGPGIDADPHHWALEAFVEEQQRIDDFQDELNVLLSIARKARQIMKPWSGDQDVKTRAKDADRWLIGQLYPVYKALTGKRPNANTWSEDSTPKFVQFVNAFCQVAKGWGIDAEIKHSFIRNNLPTDSD